MYATHMIAVIGPNLPTLIVLGIIVLILFGKGKISSMMGEMGKGITAFKKGLDDGKKELEDNAAAEAKDVTPKAEKEKEKDEV